MVELVEITQDLVLILETSWINRDLRRRFRSAQSGNQLILGGIINTLIGENINVTISLRFDNCRILIHCH